MQDEKRDDMDIVHVNLDGISSVEDFYQRLAGCVLLPSYTACNLDALRDVLLTDVSESLCFEWPQVDEDIAQGSAELCSLKRMLDALPVERADIFLSYRDCLD